MTDPPPTSVFAVRHGETEWNLIGKHQGHLDSPLTERGTQQTRALAAGLVGRGIESVYSSDLGRALRTAEPICAELGLSVQTDERLRERHLGSLQGLTKEKFRHRYPDECRQFGSGDPDYCLPGGESIRQLYERTVGCIEDLAEKHTGKTVLIVSHGGVLNGLFYRAVSLPLSEPRRFSLLNAAISNFSVCGDLWRLETWGETSHLRGLVALDYN